MDLSFFGLIPMIVGGQPVDTPQTLLDRIYQPARDHRIMEPAAFYSPRLLGLVEKGKDHESAHTASFNPFLNGYALAADITVAPPIVQGDTAVGLVRFNAMAVPNVVSISMVKTPDGWKVDDIASVGPGERWLYSWLLEYDPFSAD